MKCKIDGCNKDAYYKRQGVCQMHYFRMMRNGKYELDSKRRKYRISNPAGYQKINEPSHPLSDSTGYVYEHRYVLYESMKNSDLSCSICEKELSWDNVRVDHIDCDVTNNNIDNLRPTCNYCNTKRGKDIEGKYILTYNGETMSATAWAKKDYVKVSYPTIIRRKLQGYSDYDCLFMKKKTHNSNQF